MYTKLILAFFLLISAGLNIYQFNKYQQLAERVFFVRYGWLHPSISTVRDANTGELRGRLSGGAEAVQQLPDFESGDFKFVGNIYVPKQEDLSGHPK